MNVESLLQSCLMTIPLMLGLWGLQRRSPNAVLADVGFCIGLILVIIQYTLMISGNPFRQALVGTMGGIYAFRLGWHLFRHRVYGKVEDSRYQALRNRWGTKASLYFFLYFQGQTLAIAIFSIPFLVLIQNPQPNLSLWEFLGIGIWALAIMGETLADGELERFRREPVNRGKTCREGLWYYSRHPNYFFEGIHWCAYVVMGMGAPNGCLTLIGPILMIWALLKVTGIPFSEAQAVTNRGDEYREYQRTTNAFIPWFPKPPSRPSL